MHDLSCEADQVLLVKLFKMPGGNQHPKHYIIWSFQQTETLMQKQAANHELHFMLTIETINVFSQFYYELSDEGENTIKMHWNICSDFKFEKLYMK